MQNWWDSPPERRGVHLAPSKSGGLGDDLERYVNLSRGRVRMTGPPSATSSDRLARVTWPPDHLTSLAPYWPNTWATSYLSWKGSGASQSGSIWSTERDRLVLREVRLLEHLDLNLRLEHFSKQIPPWQSSVRANVLRKSVDPFIDSSSTTILLLFFAKRFCPFFVYSVYIRAHKLWNFGCRAIAIVYWNNQIID